MEIKFLESNRVPRDLTFTDTWSWYRPLIDDSVQPSNP